MKFTFKRMPRMSHEPYSSVDIKRKRKVVGNIHPPCWYPRSDPQWSISFSIKKGKSFRWARMTARFENEADARAWLQEHCEEICSRYDLYEFDD